MNRMAQKIRPSAGKGLDNLHRATDTLSTMLAQEVKELNTRQKAARRDGAEAAGTMKGLKEATAVLKDLAAVAKTLNEQGADAEGRECGVVLLPPVDGNFQIRQAVLIGAEKVTGATQPQIGICNLKAIGSAAHGF